MPRIGKMLPFLRGAWSLLFLTIVLGIALNLASAAITGGDWRFTPEVQHFLWRHRYYLVGFFVFLCVITMVAIWDKQRWIDYRLLAAATVKPVKNLGVGLRPGGGDILIPDFRSNVYLSRSADRQAKTALEQRRGVVIIGRPRSGKTRMAWNLLSQYPDTLVVIPHQGHPPDFASNGLKRKDLILFADDIHLSAQTANLLAWWNSLARIGKSCRVIFTSRDGNDWNRVETNQPQLAHQMGQECRIYTSSSRGRIADLSKSEGIELAKLLGISLSEEQFAARFDGTPGSLTLDLDAMGSRYRRMRSIRVDGALASRIIDAAKLLHWAGQPFLREPVLRAVAEKVLGNSPLSHESWYELKRHCQEEGFGVFVDEEFRTYRPYLERPECVEYQPRDDEILELIPVLTELQDYEGLIYLAVVLLENGISLQSAETACRTAISVGHVSAHTLLGLVLQAQGRVQEAVDAYEQVITAGHLDALNNLGNLLVTLPGHFDDAITAWTLAAERGVDLAWVNMGKQWAKMPDREVDAVGAFKRGIRAGYTDAWFDLGYLLSNIPHKRRQAEKAYRCAIASGNTGAYTNLGQLLMEEGRDTEAMQVYRAGIAAGEVGCYNNLAFLLIDRKGAVTAQVEDLLEEAVRKGNANAIVNLATIRAQKPDRYETYKQQLLHEASRGSKLAALGLGVLLHLGPSPSTDSLHWLQIAAEEHLEAVTLLQEWTKR